MELFQSFRELLEFVGDVFTWILGGIDMFDSRKWKSQAEIEIEIQTAWIQYLNDFLGDESLLMAGFFGVNAKCKGNILNRIFTIIYSTLTVNSLLYYLINIKHPHKIHLENYPKF